MHACGTSEGGQLQAAVASTLRWARHATREIEEAGHMATSYRHAEGRLGACKPTDVGGLPLLVRWGLLHKHCRYRDSLCCSLASLPSSCAGRLHLIHVALRHSDPTRSINHKRLLCSKPIGSCALSTMRATRMRLRISTVARARSPRGCIRRPLWPPFKL